MSYTFGGAHNSRLRSTVAPFTRQSGVVGSSSCRLTPTQLAHRSMAVAVAVLPSRGLVNDSVWLPFAVAGWSLPHDTGSRTQRKSRWAEVHGCSGTPSRRSRCTWMLSCLPCDTKLFPPDLHVAAD